jgi:hypothetical protein
MRALSATDPAPVDVALPRARDWRKGKTISGSRSIPPVRLASLDSIETLPNLICCMEGRE